MGIPNAIMSALQSLPLGQKRQLSPGPPNAVPGIESPEFDVRTGEPLSSPTPWRPAERTPEDDAPVQGDRENAVLRDMGTMPGTGLSHADTPSTLSSTPSGGPSAPPSNHGDDNDTITRTAIPQIQMPDLASMPGAQHINQLQAEMDAARHPHLSGWQKALKFGLTAAPTIIGAATGGMRGAGMGAEGTAEGLHVQHQNEQDRENELLKQIGEETSSRNAAYQAAGHVATTNAQLQSTGALRDAVINSQRQVAQGHDTTRRDVAQAGNESRESMAADKLQRQQIVDQANIEAKQAQAKLAEARAAGIPAQIKIAEDRANATTQYAQAAQRRAQVMEDSYERDTFGTQAGQPIPGMPEQNGQVIGTKPYAATGPTGTTKTKIDQVDAITSVGKTLLTEIEKNKNFLGPFTGRWKNLEEMWGNLPPEAARVAGLQESFASLQPALHQFRSTTAKRDFERRLQIGSFKTNAEAMKAGVQAAMDSATEMKSAWAAGRGGSVTPGPGTARPRNAPFAPPSPQVEDWERGPDGKLRRKVAK